MLRFRCKLVFLLIADSKKQEPFKKNADKIHDITSGNLISSRSSLLPDRGKETGPASVLGSAVESLQDKKSEETDHRSLCSIDSSEDKTAISSDIAGKAVKPEDQLPPGETAAAAAAAAAVEQSPAEAETLRSSARQSEEFESSVLKVTDSETPQSHSAATEPTIEAKRMFRKQYTITKLLSIFQCHVTDHLYDGPHRHICSSRSEPNGAWRDSFMVTDEVLLFRSLLL